MSVPATARSPNAIKDASSLYKLRTDPPPDGDALARRAQGDFGPIIDAMWGAGYYDAAVTISIDRASLTIQSSDIAGFARAADGYRNRAVAPVTIAVDPGPLFSLRSIRVLGPGGAELSEAELPARIVRLKPGDSAAAADLRAAEARIVDYFRKQGRPLARIASVAPVVDHAAHVMDVTFTADPGPVAPFGEATMNGPKDFDPRIARSFLYIEPGDPYSPRAIEDARNSIRQIPAVGGVRITEGTALDASWPPSLHRRRRGPPALWDRRVGEIFDHQRPGRPGLLGGPQRLRRRRAAAPAGRRLLCAAVVRDLAGDQKLLDQRSRISLLGELPEARSVGHAERPFGRRARRTDEHQRRGLPRLRGRGRRRDGGAAPSVQPEFLAPGRDRGADRRRDRRARPSELYARRRAGVRQLRHDRQQARPDAGGAAHAAR